MSHYVGAKGISPNKMPDFSRFEKSRTPPADTSTAGECQWRPIGGTANPVGFHCDHCDGDLKIATVSGTVMDCPTELWGQPLAYWMTLWTEAKTKGLDHLPTKVIEAEYSLAALREQLAQTHDAADQNIKALVIERDEARQQLAKAEAALDEWQADIAKLRAALAASAQKAGQQQSGDGK